MLTLAVPQGNQDTSATHAIEAASTALGRQGTVKTNNGPGGVPAVVMAMSSPNRPGPRKEDLNLIGEGPATAALSIRLVGASIVSISTNKRNETRERRTQPAAALSMPQEP